METERVLRLTGRRKRLWQDLMISAELHPEEDGEETVLLWQGEELCAAGSRRGNLLKCLAVNEKFRGEGLSASLLTALRQSAFEAGHRHLFLYTKPKNKAQFSDLFFYPVAETREVLMMEDQKDGLKNFLLSLPAEAGGEEAGAVVMNCNPFTLGHRYLIETARGLCRRLYVFVLSEERSLFSAADRLEMVRRGCREWDNVTVYPTGPYLISSATFPDYFLKDRDRAGQVHCRLDLEIFARSFAPRFGITRRFVGTEPFSPLTEAYNRAMEEYLPSCGISVTQIPRREKNGAAISASRVRACLEAGDLAGAEALLPETTVAYLKEKGILK